MNSTKFEGEVTIMDGPYKTVRGTMHDGPILYMAGDRRSRLTIVIMPTAMMTAHFIQF